MKNLFCLLILFFLHIKMGELKAQSYWYQQNSGTNQGLYGVCFSDNKTGTAVGTFDTILRTTDGGKTWSPQNSGTSNLHFFDVTFVDPDTGIVVGIGGTILRTTNGGVNWTRQLNGIIAAILSVSFGDKNNGTAVGHTGIILRTTNGGISWEQKPDAPTTLRAVHFTDKHNGFAVGDNGLVMRTTDGGDNWFEQPSGIQVNLQGVCFTDTTTGTVVGGSNLTGARIYRTTDAGGTWTLQHNIPNVALTDVYFTDSQTGTAVGWDGIILHTSDGGATWINEISGTNNTLLSVTFVNSEKGYAAGGVGTILVKADSGVTDVDLEFLPEKFILEQNYPNPFNPHTKIQFSLSRRSFVNLTVFNSLGAKIETLIAEELNAGTYNYDWNANGLPSGVYFYTLRAGNFIATKKLILLK